MRWCLAIYEYLAFWDVGVSVLLRWQMSHRGGLNSEVAVEPGETEIVHHLMVVDSEKPYRYPGYSLAWRWEVV